MATQKQTRTCCGGVQITIDQHVQIEHLDMPGIQVVLAKESFADVHSAAECAVLVEKALAEAGILLSLPEHVEIGKMLFAMLKQ